MNLKKKKLLTICTCICRWNIVIHVHGGADGYSRLVLYLKAYNNKRAETVFVAFEAFMEYAEYRFNERMRSDKDGENIKVAEYMLKTKGTGHGSIIDGCNKDSIFYMFLKLYLY